MSGGSVRSTACVRCCLVLLAVASALYVSWPALRWHLKVGLEQNAHCGPCVCNCPPPLSLHAIAPGLVNLSIADCGKHDPELSKEMERQPVDLLTEELQLREVVVEEYNSHMNLTLWEAQRLASQYQKEAEKCIAATETCEEGRERAEVSLRNERKVTSMWEQRAIELGWKGE